MKPGLTLWFVATFVWAFHAASVRILFGHDVIALLLSPGAHSSFLGLGVGVVFVLTRVLSVVVAPALALVGAASILLHCARRAPS